MIHLRENFWAVEVPEGAHNFRILTADASDKGIFYDVISTHWMPLPAGTLKIIGISKDLTEEQARGIVECDAFYDGYKDYDTNNFHNDLPFISPLDSLHSLLTSKGLDPENSLIIQKM